ncbi:MAG: hypothetical protein LBD34_02215 [Puniceicoccales bacterium]|jgi:hypothetical protein|nr:hypothetical protein [Puniceicoccales bacterium]
MEDSKNVIKIYFKRFKQNISSLSSMEVEPDKCPIKLTCFLLDFQGRFSTVAVKRERGGEFFEI